MIEYDELSDEVDDLLDRLDAQDISSSYDTALLPKYPPASYKLPLDYGPDVGDMLSDYEEW